MPRIKNWRKLKKTRKNRGLEQAWTNTKIHGVDGSTSSIYVSNTDQIGRFDDGQYVVQYTEQARVEPVPYNMSFHNTKKEAMAQARQWMKNHPYAGHETIERNGEIYYFTGVQRDTEQGAESAAKRRFGQVDTVIVRRNGSYGVYRQTK